MSGRAARRAALAVFLLTVLLGGCGGEDESDSFALDGSPRIPDAEGVVAEVSRRSLRLEDGKTYEIGDTLSSFSSQTMEAVPVLQRKGQYVHVGLDGDRLVWIGAIGSVVDGDPPVVYYTGEIASVDTDVQPRRLVFVDGTVLRVADGVGEASLPKPQTGVVVAELDPARKLVVAVRAP